jgi:hypothetical protein
VDIEILPFFIKYLEALAHEELSDIKEASPHDLQEWLELHAYTSKDIFTLWKENEIYAMFFISTALTSGFKFGLNIYDCLQKTSLSYNLNDITKYFTQLREFGYSVVLFKPDLNDLNIGSMQEQYCAFLEKEFYK